METVLVIGASGLVGGAVARGVGARGITVVRGAHSRPEKGGVAVDIADRHSVVQAFDQVRPQVVVVAVNIPGGVDACETNPTEAEKCLVQGSRNVIDACRERKIRVVAYSTDYLFDGERGLYREDEVPRPLSRYGEAKLAEERTYLEDPSTLVIRTNAVSGWDPSSKCFAMQIWSRLSAGTAMNVPSDQWCNPTLASWLAEVTWTLMERGVTGVLHVAGKDYMTRYELAKALAGALGLDRNLLTAVPTSALGQKAKRPMKGGLAVEKLEHEIGIPALAFEDALDRFQQERGNFPGPGER